MGIYELGIVICFVLWIVALIDIIRSKFKKDRYKFIWLCAIFLLPGIGVLTYFLFASKHKLEEKNKRG